MQINLEITSEMNVLIQKAAHLSQLSVDDFFLKTAYQAARKTLEEIPAEKPTPKFPNLSTFRKGLPPSQMKAADLISQMRDQEGLIKHR